MKCRYSNCPNKELTEKDDYVEVRTVLPSPAIFQKLKPVLLVSWKKSGEARFHEACWDILQKATKTNLRDGSGPKLGEAEKCLLQEAAKTVEYFDSQDSLKKNAAVCARLIKSSHHCTVFTGAGISTTAGIGDFRGKAGKWTKNSQQSMNMDAMIKAVGGLNDLPAKGASAHPTDYDSDDDDAETEGPRGGFSYKTLRPTYTHEALKKLMDKGYLKYVISQNCDGLHVLSGIPAENISELHGNVFVEVCEKCATRYIRKSYVCNSRGNGPFTKRCEHCRLNHRTGRKCEKQGCNGYLKDSIINFRDSLEEEVLGRAISNAKKSDFMLCLGSSLTVSPANSLVEMTTRPEALAICNRQTTHMDSKCRGGARVYADCDDLMREIMKHVLDEKELREWEEERKQRLEEYSKMRV